jgi:hypothetical protein
MGVPTTEVSYTPAITVREDHEVNKGHVLALEKKTFTQCYLLQPMYWPAQKLQHWTVMA